MASTHEYPVNVTWIGGRDGSGSLTTDHLTTPVPLAIPPEFQGTGQGTNPEELLTSAVCACYSLTFGIIAVNRKLEYSSIETTATGQVEQTGAMLKFTKITIRPVITLQPGADDAAKALATDLAHKADAYCIITNAVRGQVEIEVEPTIK